MLIDLFYFNGHADTLHPLSYGKLKDDLALIYYHRGDQKPAGLCRVHWLGTGHADNNGKGGWTVTAPGAKDGLLMLSEAVSELWMAYNRAADSRAHQDAD